MAVAVGEACGLPELPPLVVGPALWMLAAWLILYKPLEDVLRGAGARALKPLLLLVVEVVLETLGFVKLGK